MHPETGFNPFNRPMSAASDFERRRAELDPVARRIVDRRYAQLKNLYAKYGVADAQEAYARMKRGEINVPKEDVMAMGRLMDDMERELNGVALPEMQKLSDQLKTGVSWLRDTIKKLEEQGSEDENAAVKAIEEHFRVDELPGSLALDDSLMEKTLSALAADEDPNVSPKDKLDIMGVVASTVFNSLAARLPEGQEPEQVVDLSELGPVGHLGQRWRRGRLIVRGLAGDNTGFDMQDGVIDLPDGAGDGLASGMKGGTINAKAAGGRVGWFMHGGRVNVQETIGGISGAFLGGEIWVAGQRIK